MTKGALKKLTGPEVHSWNVVEPRLNQVPQLVLCYPSTPSAGPEWGPAASLAHGRSSLDATSFPALL